VADSGVDTSRFISYEEVVDKMMGTVQRRVVMRAPKDAEVSEIRFKIAAFLDDEEAPSGVQDLSLKVNKASTKYTESKYPPIFQT
jgi:hypothetical protein